MWMNESEIDGAATRYRLHPVLGPATQTLVNLVNWTNSNSDGWPYWRKPAQAADKLMLLIGSDVAYRVAGADRQDATMEAYRAALTPLKAFRTRHMRQHNLSCDALFEIIDREGGEIWVAELEYAEAQRRYESHAAYTATLREMATDAGDRLAELRQLEDARSVLAAMEAADADARLIELATPGAALWLLPRHSEHGYIGIGRPAVSLGMTGPTDRHVVVIKAEGDHDRPHSWLRLYPMIIHTLAEARRMWWVIDGDRNVVNWSTSRERSEKLRDANHPGCQVRPGSDFLPESA